MTDEELTPELVRKTLRNLSPPDGTTDEEWAEMISRYVDDRARRRAMQTLEQEKSARDGTLEAVVDAIRELGRKMKDLGEKMDRLSDEVSRLRSRIY